MILYFRAIHKLLGNFLATSRIPSNFLHSEQFLSLSSNSEMSEQLLVLNPNLYSAVCMGCVYILSDDHDHPCKLFQS